LVVEWKVVALWLAVLLLLLLLQLPHRVPSAGCGHALGALLSLHEVGTKTNHHAFFSSPQVGLNKTGEGNNQHPAPSSLGCGHRPHITAAVPLEQPAAADRAQP